MVKPELQEKSWKKLFNHDLNDKVMKIILLLILFHVTSLFAQNNREIFDSLKVYHYQALFINENGDTLSNEMVSLQSTGKPWSADPKQDLAIYNYYSSDSVVSGFTNPMNEKLVWKPLSYHKESRTGVIETDSSIWIHPFRSNQYCYTEVAPFPTVKNPKSLKVGDQYSGGTLFIMSGWGAFKGKVKSSFEVIDTKNHSLNGSQISDCFEIVGSGVHDKLGESKTILWFNSNLGFLKMEYFTYDGNQIIFKLVEIEKL